MLKLSGCKFLSLQVQVPKAHAEHMRIAIAAVCDLRYGDYDQVSFEEAEGTQFFRALGSGRNRATAARVDVPCIQLTAQLPDDPSLARDVICAIYGAHPYEEPVIALTPSLGMRHIRGVDEDNPNRFWNQDTPDWVPEAHR